MKRAPPPLLVCLSDKAKIALFQNCQTFILIQDRALPPGKTEEQKPDPGQLECGNPPGGGGMVRLGID